MRAESVRISKYLARVLRHRPEAANLQVDQQGWAPVGEVLAAIRARFGPFEIDDLTKLVRTNDKQRYVLNEHETHIRAAQGHSIEVDLGLKPVQPPPLLYHGTKAAFMPSIWTEGLVKGRRHHVHLSPYVETAKKVGSRRAGETLVLEIRSGLMLDHAFFISANGVWLTDHVPPEFLRIAG